MASLAESLAQINGITYDRCPVGKTLRTLTPADVEALSAALADRNVVATALARVLLANGISLTPASLQRHRRGQCACTPAAA